MDHVRGEDVESSIAELHEAIKALKEFAIDHGVAVVMPCELRVRNRTAIARAVNTFKEFSEISTILVAASGSAANSGSLLARKVPAGAAALAFPFRVLLRDSVRTLIWDALADGTMSDELPF